MIHERAQMPTDNPQLRRARLKTAMRKMSNTTKTARSHYEVKEEGSGNFVLYKWEDGEQKDWEDGFSSRSEAEDAGEAYLDSSKTSNTKRKAAPKMSAIDEARKLAAARVAARKTKKADTVDPDVSDDGALDDEEAVDVTEEVTVDHATDTNNDQVSETADGGKDDTINFDVDKPKETGNATINFLPKGASRRRVAKPVVKKASIAKISELTDLSIAAGIVAEKDRYAKMSKFENLDSGLIDYTIDLLKAVNSATAKKVASVKTANVRNTKTATRSPMFGRNRTAATEDDQIDALLTWKPSY